MKLHGKLLLDISSRVNLENLFFNIVDKSEFNKISHNIYNKHDIVVILYV